MPRIDLKPYRRDPESLKGHTYPPGHIDREHPAHDILYCKATAEYLYKHYTPTRIDYRYKEGRRPKIDAIVDAASVNARNKEEMVIEIIRWITHHITTSQVWPSLHPNMSVKDILFGGTEEAIIDRGYGYCNEMARVFVTACHVAGIPGRLVFGDTPKSSGHVMSEVYLDRGWRFFDAWVGGFTRAPDGHVYSAAEIHHSKRAQARVDRANEQHYRIIHRRKDHPEPYSAYLSKIRICNYPLSDSMKHFRKFDKARNRAQIKRK